MAERQRTAHSAKVARHSNEKEHSKKKWIQGAIKHKGALHESLHVPEGKKIPESKLKKAEHSKNPTTKKRALLAETLKHLHHK